MPKFEKGGEEGEKEEKKEGRTEGWKEGQTEGEGQRELLEGSRVWAGESCNGYSRTDEGEKANWWRTLPLSRMKKDLDLQPKQPAPWGAVRLFLPIKFYLNAALCIPLHILYGCAGLRQWKRVAGTETV